MKIWSLILNQWLDLPDATAQILIDGGYASTSQPGSSDGGSSTTAPVYDAADLNQDGEITDQEWADWRSQPAIIPGVNQRVDVATTVNDIFGGASGSSTVGSTQTDQIYAGNDSNGNPIFRTVNVHPNIPTSLNTDGLVLDPQMVADIVPSVNEAMGEIQGLIDNGILTDVPPLLQEQLNNRGNVTNADIMDAQGVISGGGTTLGDPTNAPINDSPAQVDDVLDDIISGDVDPPSEPWVDNGPQDDDWVWYDHDNDPSTADVFGPPADVPVDVPGNTPTGNTGGSTGGGGSVGGGSVGGGSTGGGGSVGGGSTGGGSSTGGSTDDNDWLDILGGVLGDIFNSDGGNSVPNSSGVNLSNIFGGGSSSSTGWLGDLLNQFDFGGMFDQVINAGLSDYAVDSFNDSNKDMINFYKGIFDQGQANLDPYNQLGQDNIANLQGAADARPDLADPLSGQLNINPNTNVNAPSGSTVDVNQIDIMDPNNPFLRAMQKESMRNIMDSGVAQGKLHSGGTLKALNDSSNANYAGFMNALQGIQASQDGMNLAANNQGFGQDMAGASFNFGQGQSNIDNQLDLNSQLFSNLFASNNQDLFTDSHWFDKYKSLVGGIGQPSAAGQASMSVGDLSNPFTNMANANGMNAMNKSNGWMNWLGGWL